MLSEGGFPRSSGDPSSAGFAIDGSAAGGGVPKDALFVLGVQRLESKHVFCLLDSENISLDPRYGAGVPCNAQSKNDRPGKKGVPPAPIGVLAVRYLHQESGESCDSKTSISAFGPGWLNSKAAGTGKSHGECLPRHTYARDDRLRTKRVPVADNREGRVGCCRVNIPILV